MPHSSTSASAPPYRGAHARIAASTASACLRRLSPFVYSHNSSQASARSGMSEFCSTKRVEPQKGTKSTKENFELFRVQVSSFALFVPLWLLACGGGEVAWAR